MVDVFKSDTVGVAATGERNESGHEHAPIIPALDQAVDRFAVGANSRDHHFAAFVGQRLWLVCRLSTTLDRQLERRARIIDPESDVLHAVAVFVDVSGNLAVGSQRRRQNDSDFILHYDVAGAIPRARLRPPVSYDFVPKNLSVELRGLLCVTDVKLDEIRSVDREGIGNLLRCRKCRGSHDFSGSTRCWYRLLHYADNYRS